MRTIIYISLFLSFSSLLLFAHNEFYKRKSSGSCEYIEGSWNSNNGEFFTWELYYNIPIAADWTQDFPIFELNVFTVEDQFFNAVANWNLFTGIQLFEQQSSFGNNVKVRFIDDNEVIFPMPASEYLYALTIHKFEETNGLDRIVVFSDECDDQGVWTYIFLNNTTGKQFQWRTDHFIPSISQMDFEYTVSHELGHVLGLAHCSYDYPETMMNAQSHHLENLFHHFQGLLL